MSAERERLAGFGRLEEGLLETGEWYRWGPYLSERQWGTVAIPSHAWNHVLRDQAPSGKAQP